MAHAGHTRHVERVYCPFGQYAAFAGLWPGPYALRCRYGLVAIRATLSASIAHSGNTPLLQGYGRGHTPCGVAMAHAGHTRHIARVYIFQ